MKCHWCSKELEELGQEKGYETEYKTYECPDNHIHVKVFDGKVNYYQMYWDADPLALERYKIISSFAWTHLYLSKVDKVSHRYRNYKEIFAVPRFIPLSIHEGQIQFNNLVQRLKKLNVFS